MYVSSEMAGLRSVVSLNQFPQTRLNVNFNMGKCAVV